MLMEQHHRAKEFEILEKVSKIMPPLEPEDIQDVS